MAAQKENLLSPGNLTCTERDTFSKQREHNLKKRLVMLQADLSTAQSIQNLRAMQLQQRWQELEERELKAKHHNRQLLQQFEEAQDALREMLTLTANMKTIRTEYERYLKENSPRWQQQLKKQTQVAQKKKMDEYLRSCLKNTEATTKSSSDQPLPSQGLYAKTQNIAPPQSHNNNLGFNQDGSPHLPFMPSSWLTHPQYQTARFPTRAPYQPQHSPHTPPIYPHFHPFPLPHLASTSGHYSPGWGSLQPDYPWSLTAGAAGLPSHSEALLDQRHTEELPPERREAQHVEENADTSRSSSSQRGGGGGSRGSHLSQELDVKPVRLSSSHAESSESSRESDQVSRENRRKKKREGRSQSSSSGREAPGSQDASSSSNAITFAAATAPQSSESDASSEKRSSRRTRRSRGLAVGSPGPEEVMKEGSSRGTRGDSGSPKEESQSIGEEVESHNEESRSEKADIPESGSQREEESVSVSVKTEKGSLKGAEKEESESSEHSSVGENVELEEEQEKDPGDGVDDVEKENGKTDEEQEERDEEDEASNVKNTTEEDDETAAEDEMEEQDCEEEAGLKNGDDGHRTQGSASSQGEDVDESERGEGKMDEDGESDEERGSEEGEDQRSDRAGEPEEGDSEDSIIAPQDNRIKKKIYVIPEAVEDEDEDDEGSITQSSDEDSNSFSDEDIEHLLAPQEQSNKKQAMEKSAAEKPKGNSDEVEVFHVEQCNSPKTDHQSDSDEFDHFYD